jgi:hypothetical protein
VIEWPEKAEFADSIVTVVNETLSYYLIDVEGTPPSLRHQRLGLRSFLKAVIVFVHVGCMFSLFNAVGHVMIAKLYYTRICSSAHWRTQVRGCSSS